MRGTRKSTLMTPDPYHIPGYCGYCPQFKYQIGETFGRTTSQLLTTSSVACSGRPVLSDITPHPRPPKDNRRSLIAARCKNLGDQKLCDEMVPNYTGYIPKGEHYFGKPYADTCLSAIASFQEDQVKNHQKIRDLRTIAELQKGKDVPKELISSDTLITTKYQTPLKSITIRPKAYYSPFALQHSLSPFIMSNDDPKKFLMSGYTGFVPRARGEMGMGYPSLTNKALCDFAVESDRLKRVKELPITVNRPEIKLVDTKPIYIRGSGQVPHYTGHVPGEKFRYGMTFGYSTQNATPMKALTA
ncbi:protein FAM166B-like [Stylophora pistillata]|uniref:Protein FAM166B n=1 Tax=Stylophora pistillata TaxID=50429 RepID=A0A2B4RCW3_STYPI|nr:protein FAM166B-like [Stylophora pistillata]PFX14218.1 Protein FAM166B [Stylophora pistillata]